MITPMGYGTRSSSGVSVGPPEIPEPLGMNKEIFNKNDQQLETFLELQRCPTQPQARRQYPDDLKF